MEIPPAPPALVLLEPAEQVVALPVLATPGWTVDGTTTLDDDDDDPLEIIDEPLPALGLYVKAPYRNEI